VFQFSPAQSHATGEGGMITTNDDALEDKVRLLRDHGAAMSDLHRPWVPRPYLLAGHPDAGYNQRMTYLQAALGAAQMDRAADIITEWQRLASVYGGAFANLSRLKTPVHMAGFERSYQSYPYLFQPEPITPESVPRINKARNDWMDRLQQVGISTLRPRTQSIC
jgi:perosamine synthetase